MLNCRFFSEFEVFRFQRGRRLVCLAVFESFLEGPLTSPQWFLSRRASWPGARHLNDCLGGNGPRMKYQEGISGAVALLRLVGHPRCRSVYCSV